MVGILVADPSTADYEQRVEQLIFKNESSSSNKLSTDTHILHHRN